MFCEADFRDVRTDTNTVPRGQNRYLRYGPRGPLQINIQETSKYLNLFIYLLISNSYSITLFKKLGQWGGVREVHKEGSGGFDIPRSYY